MDDDSKKADDVQNDNFEEEDNRILASRKRINAKDSVAVFEELEKRARTRRGNSLPEILKDGLHFNFNVRAINRRRFSQRDIEFPQEKRNQDSCRIPMEESQRISSSEATIKTITANHESSLKQKPSVLDNGLAQLKRLSVWRNGNEEVDNSNEAYEAAQQKFMKRAMEQDHMVLTDAISTLTSSGLVESNTRSCFSAAMSPEKNIQVAVDVVDKEVKAQTFESGAQADDVRTVEQLGLTKGTLKLNPKEEHRHQRRSRRRKVITSKKWWIRRPDDVFLSYWIWILFVCILYNLWSIFMRIAYHCILDDYVVVFLTFDYMSDVVYIADIFIRSHTAFRKEGLYVINSRSTRNWYFTSGWCVTLDVLSIIPIDILCMSLGVKPILRLNRYLKSHRLNSFFRIKRRRSLYPNLWRTIMLMVILAVLLHHVGCFYFMLSEYIGFGSDLWVYPTFINETTLRPLIGNDFALLSRQYLFSLYWATTTITAIGNLPLPVTSLEYMFTLMTFFFGVFIMAAVIGYVSSIISNENSHEFHVMKKIESIKRFLSFRDVPSIIQERVRRWYQYTSSENHIIDEQSLMNSLPLKFRTLVALNINLNTLLRVSIFRDIENEFLKDLVLKLKPQMFLPNSWVCRKGDLGREMYIINNGEIEVISDNNRVVATLRKGSYFGEIAVLGIGTVNKRTANVRSNGYSDIFILDKDELLETLSNYPVTKSILENRVNRIFMEDAKEIVGNTDSSLAYPSSMPPVFESFSNEKPVLDTFGITENDNDDDEDNNFNNCDIDDSIRRFYTGDTVTNLSQVGMGSDSALYESLNPGDPEISRQSIDSSSLLAIPSFISSKRSVKSSTSTPLLIDGSLKISKLFPNQVESRQVFIKDQLGIGLGSMISLWEPCSNTQYDTSLRVSYTNWRRNLSQLIRTELPTHVTLKKLEDIVFSIMDNESTNEQNNNRRVNEPLNVEIKEQKPPIIRSAMSDDLNGLYRSGSVMQFTAEMENVALLVDVHLKLLKQLQRAINSNSSLLSHIVISLEENINKIALLLHNTANECSRNN